MGVASGSHSTPAGSVPCPSPKACATPPSLRAGGRPGWGSLPARTAPPQGVSLVLAQRLAQHPLPPGRGKAGMGVASGSHSTPAGSVPCPSPKACATPPSPFQGGGRDGGRFRLAQHPRRECPLSLPKGLRSTSFPPGRGKAGMGVASGSCSTPVPSTSEH